MFTVLNDIETMFEELNAVSITARLLFSMLCGGVIGIDRARKRRPAGTRTYMLVCLGAALAMITNQYLLQSYPGADPARLGAQVISGIGFLGAGTIIVTRHHQVIGLTTAAGLWASACMGLAVGIGFYEGAFIACILIFVIMYGMRHFENAVVANSRVMEVYLELEESVMLSEFLGYIANHSIKVTYIDLVKPQHADVKGVAAIITLKLPKRFEHIEVLQQLGKLDGVSFIEEV